VADVALVTLITVAEKRAIRYHPGMELRATLFVLSTLAVVGCGNSVAGGGNGNGDGGTAVTASCSDPATACGAECVDLRNDPANCGMCGQTCAAANVEHALCLDGTCAYDTCDTGFADCDNNEANGCETPTATDVHNCGGCGIECAPANGSPATCTNGVCTYGTCAAGFGDCDGDAGNGCETSLGDDNANCGKCGNACTGGTVCAGGTCGLVCTGTLTLCGSGANAFCTLTDDDPQNCGACGHACAPMHADNASCTQGQCGYHQCDSLYGDCDGDPSNGCETCLTCTITNCGGCGIDCTAVHTTDLQCSDSGTCVWTTCASGWGDCDGSTENGCETDILHDDAHCGPACMPCDAGTHCNGGTCS
jgi:hypothetical protein